ncbi:hypothetical protein BT96DRAFT_980027 [Gymnopus androsaceus JB14]|uniref:G-protein coupled receptors family 1 profile domain-containing protein n=1 Tax=Gymnopus androsaceus JB14 TaxID=1447944 RepID=A0A6A4GYR7_9AGAR|nr:hypothetical protein BT96DRAFT_980027 [Gymnopus androsaceus JB14]
MSAEEVQEIAYVGLALFQNYARAILSCTFLGIYCLLFAISLYISSYKKFTGWAKKILLCLLVTTFILTVLNVMANLLVDMLLLQYEVILPLPEGSTAEVAAVSQPLLEVGSQISTWTSNLILLIGDLIIIWRAWAVWMHSKMVKLLLAFFVLVVIGVNLADAFVDNQKQLIVTGQTVTLDCVFFALSLSVNVTLTLLIAYRTWTYYRSLKGIFTLQGKTFVARILILFVESGATLAIFQVLALTFNELDRNEQNLSPLQFATLNVSIIYLYVAALNPLAIFILMENRRQTTHNYSSCFEQDCGQKFTTFLED